MSKNEKKGYKVFNPDWTCNGFKYEVGKTYTHKGNIELCESGFHFCEKLVNCFDYYNFNPNNKVAEVVATGKIIKGIKKYVTNKIKIVREISWNDVLNIVNTGSRNTGNRNTGNYNTGNCNTGNYNTGNCNTGDCNTGNYNTGNCNTGNHNTGNCNTGNHNTGNCNTGNCNTGNCNTGNRNTGSYNTGNRNTSSYNTGNYNTGNCNTGSYNTGNYNTGNCNTGNYNTGSYNTGAFNVCNYANGLFNSKSPKIYMFNKPTKLTFEELRKKYPIVDDLLFYLDFSPIEWISKEKMSKEEKKAHPEYKVQEGYLKVFDYKKKCRDMWDNWNVDRRNEIKKLPNFDPEVFEEITGVKTNE